MRLVAPLLIMTTALADDEKRDWFRIRRTPGVRRAKGERMRGVSMTKGLNPPSKHGGPVDHPTMPRRDDHPGRPLKSRAAHIRRKRDETREKHREKTRKAKRKQKRQNIMYGILTVFTVVGFFYGSFPGFEVSDGTGSRQHSPMVWFHRRRFSSYGVKKTGWHVEEFYQTFKITTLGGVVAFVAVVPPWPIFNRHTLTWQPAQYKEKEE